MPRHCGAELKSSGPCVAWVSVALLFVQPAKFGGPLSDINNSTASPASGFLLTAHSIAIEIFFYHRQLGKMNGIPGPFPPVGGAAWTEHRTPDGRVYYYNAMTKVTQWTKPEDMMTPAEVRPIPY